jgi:hypothetical protein
LRCAWTICTIVLNIITVYNAPFSYLLPAGVRGARGERVE